MGARRVYAALYALLFTASCAWIGAALFTVFGQPRVLISPAGEFTSGGTLEGIVLRREEIIETLPHSAKSGERISAGDISGVSAIFYPYPDGYEKLSPADAVELSAGKLNELMSTAPDKIHGARLIYGFDFYYAAFYSGTEDISPGPCRIKFQGEAYSRRAEIISVSNDDNNCVVLLRLMLDENAIELRFEKAELIYQT